MAKRLTATKTLVCQKWEESELGWGTRPDGYSLHLSEASRQQFVKDYWNTMPNEAPEEYSRPDGTAYLVEVNTKTYKRVEETKNGLRFSGNPPGNRGTDGWMTV